MIDNVQKAGQTVHLLIHLSAIFSIRLVCHLSPSVPDLSSSLSS